MIALATSRIVSIALRYRRVFSKDLALKSNDFRQLAVEEMDAVYRMAFHLTRHPDEAADLVQETYLRALKAESGFELRERGIRPWLFKILHNVFYTKVG